MLCKSVVRLSHHIVWLFIVYITTLRCTADSWLWQPSTVVEKYLGLSLRGYNPLRLYRPGPNINELDLQDITLAKLAILTWRYTVRTELSLWSSVCHVGCRWVNHMDTVNCQDGMIMWRKVGWEWGKDCHVVLLHIMNCVHWIWNNKL